MKLASIIVLLAFLIVPLFIRPLMIVYTFVTKGTGGVDSLSQSSQDQKTLKPRLKSLYFIILYWALFLGVLIWAYFEIMSGFGANTQLVIMVIVICAIFISLIPASGIRRGLKIKEKFPHPPLGASDKEILEWENQIYDESVNNSGFITRFFPVLVKVCLIIMAIGLVGLIISVIGMIVTR